jgi:hypothetical protein
MSIEEAGATGWWVGPFSPSAILSCVPDVDHIRLTQRASDGAMISVADFGASAPGPVVMREFRLTLEHVVETAKRAAERNHTTT